MKIFDDTRFTKKLNSIFDLLSKTKIHKVPRIIFRDDDGFTHKLEFLWFKIQNNYWIGHTATRKDKLYIVENWTFDGKTRNIVRHEPAFSIIEKPDKSLEKTSLNTNDILKKMDLLMVELI